jgi:HEPN superfamily protein
MPMNLDPHLHRGVCVEVGNSGRDSNSRHRPEDMTLMVSNDDLQRARSSLAEAELAPRPSDRYLAAHLAALRVVAVVLSHRAPPTTGRPNGRARNGRPQNSSAQNSSAQKGRSQNGRRQNAWRMLAEVAPELAEWAAFFAATEPKRDAIRAGATSIVSGREADDLVRDAEAFLRVVERAVGFSAGFSTGFKAEAGSTPGFSSMSERSSDAASH